MSGSKSSVPAANALPEEDPMALTVHSLPSFNEVAAEQRTRAGRLRMILVMAICAAPVLASYFTFYVLQPRGQAYGELVQPTPEIPESLQLHDLSGHSVSPASLKGQWLLALVQSSACSAECERLLFMQRQLREMLGKERDKVDKLWLIPDDEPIAPALLDALQKGPPITILRVSRESLKAWLKPADGHALNEHLFLVDPLGRWMMRSPVQPDPSKIKKDLDKLLKASASWDKPGR